MDITPIFVVFLCVTSFCMFLYLVPMSLWVTAVFSGVKIPIGELIGMRIRKVPPGLIVNSLITSAKAGLSLSTRELETHFLARGDVPKVVRALISAGKANINLSFKQVAAIDLAGRDVFEAVQTSVNPKSINTTQVA